MNEMTEKEKLLALMAHADDLQKTADDAFTELRQVTDELKAVLAEFKAMASNTVSDSADGSAPDHLDYSVEDADHPFIDEPADSGESIFNKSIDELYLSTRSKNCLTNSKINLIGQLVQYREHEIASIVDLGKKSLKEIKNALNELNLSFNMRLEGLPEVNRDALRSWSAVYMEWKSKRCSTNDGLPGTGGQAQN